MTQNWIDHKKLKQRKIDIINALVEGGHDDRLLDLAGKASRRREAQDLHDQHPQVRVQGGRVKGQTEWLDRPDLGTGPGGQDGDGESVHYHSPDTPCPLRTCPLYG